MSSRSPTLCQTRLSSQTSRPWSPSPCRPFLPSSQRAPATPPSPSQSYPARTAPATSRPASATSTPASSRPAWPGAGRGATAGAAAAAPTPPPVEVSPGQPRPGGDSLCLRRNSTNSEMMVRHDFTMLYYRGIGYVLNLLHGPTLRDNCNDGDCTLRHIQDSYNASLASANILQSYGVI